MKFSNGLKVIVIALMLNGCETIKGVFPDKEKDYRFTNEIPALIVPEDLGHSDISDIGQTQDNSPAIEPSVPDAAPTTPVAVVTTPLEESAAQVSKNTEVPTPSIQEPAIDDPGIDKSLLRKDFAADVDDSEKPTITQVVALKDADNLPELRVNQNMTRTWRILGKALTRKTFEITERNLTEHYYLIQYDPDAKPLEDESIWDDVAFLFGDEKNLEQEYKVALFEKEFETAIKIYKYAPEKNTDDKKSLKNVLQPCLDEKCARLFSLLQESLQQSLKE